MGCRAISATIYRKRHKRFPKNSEIFPKILIPNLAKIYRPGTVSGDINGSCNPNDSVTQILAGLVKERIVCVGEDSPLVKSFPLVPVGK